MKNNQNDKVFINLSNHPSKSWSTQQLEAVGKLVPHAQIIDVPFPAVESTIDESEIKKISEHLTEMIMSYHPCCVMCQGEFGVTFCVVTSLKDKGISVVYSCSERRVIEKTTEYGIEKTSVFVFARFRKY